MMYGLWNDWCMADGLCLSSCYRDCRAAKGSTTAAKGSTTAASKSERMKHVESLTGDVSIPVVQCMDPVKSASHMRLPFTRSK